MLKSWILLATLAFSIPAQADFARYSRDPSVRVADLVSSGSTQIDSSHRRYDVTADASAVLNRVNFARLQQASVDFGRWAQMGMPGVVEMHVIQRISNDEMLVWMHQSAPGGSTFQYMKIRIARNLPGGAFGNTFEVVHPRTPHRLANGRVLRDSSAFSHFHGSWYLEPTGVPGQVYVRYFVDATVASALPAIIVGSVAESSMVDGIRNMVRIFAREARLQR